MARKRFVIIDFSHYDEAEFSPIVHVIINMLTLNALTFPLLPVIVATLTTHIGTYDTILGSPVYPGQADDLEAARKVIEKDLHDDGIYINGVGDGDVTIYDKSGYPLAKEPEPQGVLPQTEMLIESMDGGFKIEIIPANPIAGHTTVPGARGYLVLYVELTTGGTVPADYHEWKWAYFPKHTGQLTLLNRSAKYRMVATALGTNPQLAFSFPIDRTTQ